MKKLFGSKVFKEIFTYGFMGVISKFISIFLIPIYTGVLTQAEMGVLGLLTSIKGFLLLLLGLELHSSFFRFYYLEKYKDKREILFGTILSFYFVSSLVAFLLLLLLFQFQIKFIREYYFYLIAILASVFPNLINQIFLSDLRLQHKSREYVFFTTLISILTVGLSLITVLVFDFKLNGVFWSPVISQVVTLLIFLIIYRKNLKVVISADSFEALKEMLRYSLPLIPARSATWVRANIANFFIASVFSLEVLGVYSVAKKLSNLFLIITQAINTAWLPYASKKYNNIKDTSFFVKSLDLSLGIYSIALIGIGLCSTLLFDFVFNETYYDSLSLIPLIALPLLIDGLTSVIATGNNIKMKTTGTMYGSIIGSISIVLFYFIGLSHLSLLFVSLINISGASIKSLVIFRNSQKNYKINYNIKKILLLMTLNFFWTLLFYFIHQNTELRQNQIILSLVFGLILCLIIIVMVYNDFKIIIRGNNG